MPLYNKKEFVGAAIESVLAQTCPDWKLIVVDDSSTDGSLGVVRRFDDPRIIVVTQPNGGPGEARNTGIRAGKANWVALLDADDAWLPEHLSALDRIRRTFPSAALIATGYRDWSERGGRAEHRLSSKPRQLRYFRDVPEGRAQFFTGSAAIRRSAIDEIGPFKPLSIGEDTEYWARLALFGPVAFDSGPTVLYRRETGGLTDEDRSTAWPGRPPPSAISDVSPALATLARAVDGIEDERLRGDIDIYVDYELEIALLRALRLNEIAYARELLPLFRERPRGKAGVAARLAALPPPAGQWLLRSMFKAKWLARSARFSRGRE